MESLDDIMSGQGDVAPASDTGNADLANADGPIRDDRGRFASPQEQAAELSAEQPEAPAAPAAPPAGYVPIQALDERVAKERDRYAALENQHRQTQAQMQAFMAQFAPKPEPQPAPDFYTDPDKAVDHRTRQYVDPLIEQQRQAHYFNSRLIAESVHGKDAATAAIEAFDQAAAMGQLDPRDQQRVMASPNPFHEAVQWHKRTSVMSRLGDDPDAYIKAEIEKGVAAALAASGAQPQPSTTSAAQQPMPQSFSAARSAGPRTAPQWTGPRPLSEIMPR